MENYNSSIHSTTGKRPVELQTQITPETKKQVAAAIQKRAKQIIEHTDKQFEQLNKGDYVRVHVGSDNAFKKSYKSQWSKEVYVVINKSKPTNPLVKKSYLIQGEDKMQITNRFGRGELLKVPHPKEKLLPNSTSNKRYKKLG